MMDNEIFTPPPEDLTVKIETDAVAVEIPSPKKADIKTVSKVRAVKFVELVKAGESPQEAAKQVHTSLARLERDPEVQAMCETLIAQYTLPAETRKKLVRARLNKVVAEGNDKEAVAAAKLVSADPEVGITTQIPQVMQQFNFSPETSSFLDNLDVPEDFQK
jgi:hypothetical protein